MLDFYKGVDISSLPESLAEGMKTFDRDGREMEPFVLLKKYGVNAIRLRNEMEDAGSIFQGTSDSEIILHLIRRSPGTLLEKITKTAQQLEGALSDLQVVVERSPSARVLVVSLFHS